MANSAWADAPASRSFGALEFRHCTLSAEGLAQTVPAQCTTLTVPENRNRPDGRQLELAVAWIPARAKRPEPDPVIMLAGGPGQSARESFPAVAGAFAAINRRRDVILVDQRGTGGSAALRCVNEQGDAAVTDRDPRDLDAARDFARRCLESLRYDARFFTTGAAVEDLEAVRLALGAPAVNLVAISYGTRVAQEYMRRYPESVRAAVMDGIVPPGLALGSEHARNLDEALRLQMQRCEADAACSARFPAPLSALENLRSELAEKPLSVKFRDPLTDELQEAELDAPTLGAVARMYSYSPQLTALLPLALANLASGDAEIFMAQARMIESLVGEQITHGMQLSVLCSEDAPSLRVDPADADTLMGSSFVEFILAQCSVWPAGEVAENFHDALHGEHPALLLSGEFDPVTPPRYGERVVGTLSNGRHLVLRGQGHNVMTAGCAPGLMAAFIESADARSLDASCLEQLIYTPAFTGPYGWEP